MGHCYYRAFYWWGWKTFYIPTYRKKNWKFKPVLPKSLLEMSQKVIKNQKTILPIWRLLLFIGKKIIYYITWIYSIINITWFCFLTNYIFLICFSWAFFLLFVFGFHSEMKRSKADELSTITNESLKQQNHEIKLLLEPSSKEGGIIKQSAINNTADKVN